MGRPPRAYPTRMGSGAALADHHSRELIRHTRRRRALGIQLPQVDGHRGRDGDLRDQDAARTAAPAGCCVVEASVERDRAICGADGTVCC